MFDACNTDNLTQQVPAVVLWQGTTEFVRVDVTVDGVVVLADVEVQVVAGVSASTARPNPDGWAAATVLDGHTGMMISGLTAGIYWVWYRVTDAPETPIGLAGELLIQ